MLKIQQKKLPYTEKIISEKQIFGPIHLQILTLSVLWGSFLPCPLKLGFSMPDFSSFSKTILNSNLDTKCLHDLHLSLAILFAPFRATVQPTSVLTKASVWYEIRVLWAKINHVKSHAITLAFSLQTDMNQIFQMRYCTLS